MYNVKNNTASRQVTPYGIFNAWQTLPFEQAPVGDNEDKPLKYFNESPYFIVTIVTSGGSGGTAPVAVDLHLQTKNNLNDVDSKPIARANLGLGTAALFDESHFALAGAIPPASIVNIYDVPGLISDLKTNGWQQLDAFSSNVACGAVSSVGWNIHNANAVYTIRSYRKASFETDQVAFLLGNLNTTNDSSGATYLNPPIGSTTYRLSIQLKGSTIDDQTGPRWPVLYKGQENIVIRPGEVILTDPAPINIPAGQVWFLYIATEPELQAGGTISTNGYVSGGTAPSAMNNGEGTIDGDMTLVGSVSISNDGPVYPTPVIALGHSLQRQRSVFTVGTSIEDGTGDAGSNGVLSGWIHRLLAGIVVHTLTPTQYAALNPIPYIKATEGVRSAAQALTYLRSYQMWNMMQYSSTVLWGHANNDTLTFSNLSGNALTAANMARRAGKKIVVCTNICYSGATTDDRETLANITGVHPFALQAYNTWLRDASASGFQQQAGGPTKADYWDVGIGYEVDALGKPVLGGGYRTPPSNPAVWTGKVTNPMNAWTFIDTATGNIPNVQDVVRGYRMRMTSGFANGVAANIANAAAKYVYNAGTMFPTTIPNWAANHAYNLKEIVKSNNVWYYCSQAGTSDLVTGPSINGILDGTVCWEYMAPSAVWTSGATYAWGDFVVAAGARLYMCVKAGVAGTVAPTGTTIAVSNTDGTVEWEYFGTVTIWAGGTTYTQNQANSPIAYKYVTNGGNIYKIVTNGVSAVSGGPTTVGLLDGSVRWNLVQSQGSGILRGDTYKIGTCTSSDGAHPGTEGHMLGASGMENVAWEANTQYMNGMFVTSNGNLYKCVSAGAENGFANTGTVAPSGSADFIDGGVTWRHWTPTFGSLCWYAGQNWTLGNIIVANGNCYVCTQGGTGSFTGHGPSGTGTGIVDNGVIWDFYQAGNIPAWSANKEWRQAQVVTNDGNMYFCQVAGTGSSTGPTGTGTAIVDGGATWSLFILQPLTNNLIPWINKIA